MPTPSEWPIRPVEPLKWLNDRIEAGKPACYLRFNDGEAYSMFRMKRAPESNGEHVYSDRMRRSLLKTFVSACCESRPSCSAALNGSGSARYLVTCLE